MNLPQPSPRMPAIKVIAMPTGGNADGDIFGGWIISMMDLAGAHVAKQIARTRVVTVAIDNIVFHKPVFIGDCLECYVEVVKIGKTSITVNTEAIVERKTTAERLKVTEGQFVFVAIDGERRPVVIGLEAAII